MDSDELDKLHRYYIKIVEENLLFFPNYQAKCFKNALKIMEKKNVKNRLHKNRQINTVSPSTTKKR